MVAGSPSTRQKIRFSFIRLLTGSDLSKRRLAKMEAQGEQPGSSVWLTGCVHGDEVGGMVVIQEVFRRLRRRPLRRGSVHAFPLMNPIGFENASRTITSSREDLNRSFPGDPAGTLAERVAHLVVSHIRATEPVIVLDLHNDWIKSIPYTLIDPYPGLKHKGTYERVKRFARQTGFLVINEQEEGVTREDLRRTLSGSLLLHDVPALTLELGEAYVVNEQNVAAGVRAVWNVLGSLDMVEPDSKPSPYLPPPRFESKVLHYTHRPYCSSSGVVRFLVRPGDVVGAGQQLARIYNVFGRLEETLHAPREGVVLGHSDSSVAMPGMPLVAMGTPSPARS